MFEVERQATSVSMYWFLQEPVVYGARRAIADGSMSKRLTGVGLVTVEHLLEVVGATLDGVEGLAHKLGIRSVRDASQMLHRFREALTAKEKNLVEHWTPGLSGARRTDPFPCVWVRPCFHVLDTQSPLLALDGLTDMRFDCLNAKAMYRGCVKVLHQDKLAGLVDTPWRAHFGLGSDVKPAWRALYKPPLTKSAGDLQWRVLHGIIAVNAFVSILNPAVTSECPFCFERETVFHCFTQCTRLVLLFRVLTSLFTGFNECFTLPGFILGFPLLSKEEKEMSLVEFYSGAKSAIYFSGKKKIDSGHDCDVLLLFKHLLQARVRVDFMFSNAMDDHVGFENVWDCGGILCKIVNGELIFHDLLT